MRVATVVLWVLCACLALAIDARVDVASMPILGRNTAIEAEKARALNRILERWNDENLTIEQQKFVFEVKDDIKAFNDAIAKCRNKFDEEIYNACRRANYICCGARGYGILFEDMFRARHEIDSLDPFETAETSKVCQKISDQKLYASASNRAVFIDDELASRRLIFGESFFSGTSKTPSFRHRYLEQDDTIDDEAIWRYIKEIEKTKNRDKLDRDLDVYRKFLTHEFSLFELENEVYLSLSNRPHNDGISVYKFDKKAHLFDQACEFKTASAK